MHFSDNANIVAIGHYCSTSLFVYLSDKSTSWVKLKEVKSVSTVCGSARLLNKYWNDFGDCDGRDKDEEATRLKLKNAQTKEQSVHCTRNDKGYVLKCSDVQFLISDQIELGEAKLIGYSMPRAKEGSLQLFWRKGNGKGIKELPDEAVICREESSVIKLSII